MFNTFIRWQFQRTYDALLAAPVDVEELVTAEILWISIRAGVYGLAPLLVGIFVRPAPSAGDAAGRRRSASSPALGSPHSAF